MTTNDALQFPWHTAHWDLLQKRRQQSRLPHALLLSGAEGLGKQKFAERFIHSLLCESPDSDFNACHHCRNCTLVHAGSHPDWINVQPEKAGSAIKIDQVRSLVSFLTQTSQYDGYKIVLVHEADALNVNAANALLKTLEEPSENSFIVLITNRLMMLPATVRSRCQILNFYAPSTHAAENWLLSQGIAQENIPLLLSLAKGAPLKVLAYVEEDMLAFRKTIFDQWLQYTDGSLLLTQISAEWSKLELDQLFFHWRSWITDLVRWYYVQDNSALVNIDQAETFRKLSEHCNMMQLYQFYDELNKLEYFLAKKISLNVQLLIENLLIQWKEVCKLSR